MQDAVREIPFVEFAEAVDTKEVSFTRVRYFKRGGAVVWPELAAKLLGGDIVDQSLLDLPDGGWLGVVSQLCARDLCILAQAHSQPRQRIALRSTWAGVYERLFGLEPAAETGSVVLRRACRLSEQRVEPWLEKSVPHADAGATDVACIGMDMNKVVGGEGSLVRMWSHDGRRLCTLKGHSGTVRCLAFNQAHLLTADDSHASLRLWDLDSLDCLQALRVPNDSPPRACLLLPSNGTPAAACGDGSVLLYDAGAQTSTPIAALRAEGDLQALAAAPSGLCLAAGGLALELFDVAAAVRIACVLGSRDDAAGLAPVEALHLSDSLLAAGSDRVVGLWDPRASILVGRCPAAGCPSRCAGVHLDDWKLTCVFQEDQSRVRLYDLRALPSGRTPGEALAELDVGGSAQCLAVCGQSAVVGRRQLPCRLWAPGTPGGDRRAGPAEPAVPAQERDRRAKKGKIPINPQNRYPKRNHR